MEETKSYNFFSILSYILILIKFPVLLFFDNSQDNLSIYFIIISFSIAINFIAIELISYKDLKKGLDVNTLLLGLLFLLISSSIIFLNFIDLFYLFLVYNLITFLHSISISRLRSLNITYIMYLEIIISILQLTLSIFLSKIIFSNLGFSLVVSTLIIYVSVFLFLFSINIIKPFEISLVKSPKKILSINLYFDMIITQIERFILSVYLPTSLAFISIISALTTGLKRLVYDDNQLDISIKHKKKISFSYDKVIIKFSFILIFSNIISFIFFKTKFFLSNFFIEFIKTIKPNFIIIDINYIFIISSLYFGLAPISFFVSHHFRNGKFTISNYLCYTPFFLLIVLMATDIFNVSSEMFLYLLLFTTSHFVLFFFFLSRKYYSFKNSTTIIVGLNYIFGLLIAFYITYN